MIEEHIQTPITDSCDVLVVGGGVAGISAALAAARHGANVIIAEREYALGGLATLGLVTIYLPLCDGMGNQISFGLAEELLHLSIKHGTEDKYPYAWLDGNDAEARRKQRFQVQFNPQLFALETEKLLLQSGVKIIYGTHASAVSVCDNKISAVIFEGKSGRQAICARSFVDATGDADICHMSGEDTAVYAQGNGLAAWYYYTQNGNVNLQILGMSDVLPNGGEKPEPLVKERFSGLDTAENSRIVCLSHQKVLEHVLSKRKTDAGIWPVNMAAIPQLRMTRRLDGATVLDDKHPHDLIISSIGITGDWRRCGPAFAIPFEALYGKKILNLITAGRCISVTDDMWDITRVIPCCAVTGQAAGTAAAMCDDYAEFDVRELQEHLKNDGVRLN